MATDKLWTPHDDPQLGRFEDELTAVGSSYLYAVQREVWTDLGLPELPEDVLREAYHTATLPTFAKAAPPSRGEAFGRARRFFEGLRGMVRAVTPRQVRELAEAITEKWYSEGRIETRAQRQAMKNLLAGKIYQGAKLPRVRQANLEAVAQSVVAPDPGGLRALEYARERSGELIRGLKDATRQQVALTVLEYQAAPSTPFELASRLQDRFATLNRDHRRVALTETAMAYGNGFLAGIPVGEFVEWRAALDCCKHCKKYHGKTFKVVSEPGDHHTEVWVGKSNFGRSFAPTTADGRRRTEDELAGPVIPAHQNCRCNYVRSGVQQPLPDVLEAEFAYLESL